MVFTVAPPTISQVFQSLVRSPLPLTPPWGSGGDPAVRHATATLYALLETLCAPEGGWPETTPKTPTTLLPYVMDEVGDLVEALQAAAAHPPRAVEGVSGEVVDRPTALLSNWSARLVWAIAASSAEAMQLLEGLPAAIASYPTLETVRLVPVLTLRWSDYLFGLDLVAQTGLEIGPLLGDDCCIELGAEDAEPSLSVGEWREMLWRSLLTFLPEIAPWQEGSSLELLVPGQDWVTAEVQLALHLVGVAAPALQPIVEDGEAFHIKTEASLLELGMPSPRVWVAQPAPSADWLDDAAAISGLDTCYPASTDTEIPALSLDAELDWQATDLQAAIIAHYLEDVSDRLQRQWRVAALSLETLVAHVFAALEVPHSSPTPELAWRRSPRSLGDLCTHLQWLWVRLSADFMPFLAGIPTYRLRPHHPWEVGTLTASSQVWITPEGGTSQGIDIATRQSVSATVLRPDDTLHLQSSPFLPKLLWQTAELEQFLTTQLEPRSPLLPFLLRGIPLRWVADPSIPCHLQLGITLNFYRLE